MTEFPFNDAELNRMYAEHMYEREVSYQMGCKIICSHNNKGIAERSKHGISNLQKVRRRKI